MKSISATSAKRNLSKTLKDVQFGPIMIQRYGSVLLTPEDYKQLVATGSLNSAKYQKTQ